MGKNSEDALELGAWILIFIAILSYFVYSFVTVPHKFTELQAVNEVYVQNNDIPENEYLTGSQVIGKLYRISEEGIAIKVDGLLFENDKDVKKNQNQIDTKSQYKMTLTYGVEGKVTSITYNKVD